MTPDRKVIRLRPHEEFTGGPAWTDAELMELLNAEQIVTLWTTHLFSRQKGSSEWRPVERESEVREAIDNWHEGFDLFAAAQDDADTLRDLRRDLLVQARQIRLLYEEQ
jgi:hypothetical protein